MSFDEKLKKMQKIKDQAKLGGGQDRIDKQHDQGKLTARERIDLHLKRFWILIDSIKNNKTFNTNLLDEIEKEDRIFPLISAIDWKKKI